MITLKPTNLYRTKVKVVMMKLWVYENTYKYPIFFKVLMDVKQRGEANPSFISSHFLKSFSFPVLFCFRCLITEDKFMFPDYIWQY
jgi:hypothetical protein